MLIDRKPVERYVANLVDKYRPPSRGGNTRAWHQHRLTIDGEVYSFLALGKKKWVFTSDVVSFEWELDSSGQYKNVNSATVQVWDKNGNKVFRGIRGSKPFRTAPTRLPGSGREQRD